MLAQSRTATSIFTSLKMSLNSITRLKIFGRIVLQTNRFFMYYKLSSSHASVFKLTPEDARKKRSELLEDEELHDPNEVPVPSFVPDTPLFRERMALFYDALTNVDKQVGEILNELERQGLSDDTIVVFWADHGAGDPRGKIHVGPIGIGDFGD